MHLETIYSQTTVISWLIFKKNSDVKFTQSTTIFAWACQCHKIKEQMLSSESSILEFSNNFVRTNQSGDRIQPGHLQQWLTFSIQKKRTTTKQLNETVTQHCLSNEDINIWNDAISHLLFPIVATGRQRLNTVEPCFCAVEPTVCKFSFQQNCNTGFH